MAGQIRQIVDHLERCHSPFLVSRLILMTGLRLQDFTPSSPDDPTVLRKLERALRSVLTAMEMRPLEQWLAPDETPGASGGNRR
jgi:hypothetical protein